MIGVVGMNWVYQPPLDLEETVDKVNILAVKSITGTEYVSRSQDNLAAGKSPLARRLYMINCQGYSGLGMGFTSFIGSERGQRIILKSGLVPERFPTRKIVIRNKITKDKN
jgi:phosphate transport system substrate-binding protein